MPRYPHIHIQLNLTGPEGNAFMILRKVMMALEIDGVGKRTWEEYHAEATAGDYEHLLTVTREWVVVDEI